MSNAGFEYGRSDYGFGGGGSGMYGGFDPMRGPMGGGMNDAGAGSKSAEKKSSRDRQSLIPVTIKQIATCDNVDDTFRIDGAELHMVKVVGTVVSLTEHATNFTYQVADSTGIIECKLWIDKETGAAARFEPNTLVKVCGNLREYEGRKHVLVYDIKAVEDWNELTHHFLEAVYVHLQHTKGPLQSSVPSKVAASPGMAMSPGFGGGARPGPAVSMADNNSGSRRPMHDSLMSLFRNCMSETGLSYQDAHRALQASFPAVSFAEVRKMVEDLSNDGLLYSTIDDDHYRSTDY